MGKPQGKQNYRIHEGFSRSDLCCFLRGDAKVVDRAIAVVGRQRRPAHKYAYRRRKPEGQQQSYVPFTAEQALAIITLVRTWQGERILRTIRTQKS